MDEYLEQMLLTSPWGEGNGIIGKSWCGAGVMPMESIGGGMELPKMAAMHSGHFDNEGLLGNYGKIPQQITDISNLSYPNMIMPNEGPANLMIDPGQGPPSFARLAGRFPPLSLLTANGFERPGFDGMLEGLLVPTWNQPNYVGGVPSLPSALGKRCRDDDDDEEEESATGPGAGHQSNPLSSINPSHLHQNLAISGANGGVRARARARRGEATDPHSIAERHRRERIAERMKSLQELVPDANKTDKASMLDEIIAYVRFLQMQVKCLSVCRLGGAGATAPIFSDIPGSEGMGKFSALDFNQSPGCSSQDGLERKIAGLMDEDMSAAMQYLQRKGLCLMPISLATAISTTTTRSQFQPVPPTLSKGNASDNNPEPPHIMASYGRGLVEFPLHDNPTMLGGGGGE